MMGLQKYIYMQKHMTYKGVAGHEQRRGEEVGGRAEGNL